VSDVLVSALLVRIEEIEAKAREAKAQAIGGEWVAVVNAGDGGCIVETRRGAVVAAGGLFEVGPHIALNDPQSVLRLCRAHRDLIDDRERAAMHLHWAMANGGGEYDARRELARWDQVLATLARGLGVEQS